MRAGCESLWRALPLSTTATSNLNWRKGHALVRVVGKPEVIQLDEKRHVVDVLCPDCCWMTRYTETGPRLVETRMAEKRRLNTE
jgi:hypothetical protein